MIRPGEIFVFGSNEQGRHGKGAALDAMKYHGAMYGIGRGLQGSSYAIPTKSTPRQTLSLNQVAVHISVFVYFALQNPDLNFYVTPVGCGLAGFTREQIKPLFEPLPSNCRYAETW